MGRNYIGLTTSIYDPSLAIVNSEGEIVFAETTERYLQDKRAQYCVPDNVNNLDGILARYCEKDTELVVATTWSDDFIKKLRDDIPKGTNFFEEKIIAYLWKTLYDYNQFARINIKHILYKDSLVEKSYDHHLTHAAAACYSSPYEEAVCAIADDIGEYSSTSFFHYKDGQITPLPDIEHSTGSLGRLTLYISLFCGFKPWTLEEWNVLGLAPYGEYDDDIYNLLRQITEVKDCSLIEASDLEDTYRKLIQRRERPDLRYLFTGMKVFSELMEELLGNLFKRNISENLVLGGACALNPSFNGQILERTQFEDVFIFSAPGDDGNSVGAALLAYYEDNPPKTVPTGFQTPYLGESLATSGVRNLRDFAVPAGFQTPYLGKSVSPRNIKNLMEFSKLENKLPPDKKIHERVAELLAEGKIVGWAQGRAEFGRCALGNRSVLADPRMPGIKEILNSKVKFREEFWPFALSILHEHGPDYFENYQESPYMERALRFKKEVRDKVPGVVHADGTGRLQTVKREINERYYDLISAFHDITGIPILLNTSFNVPGKPIIHTLEDAISVFFTTGLDVLVIDELLYIKD